MTIFVVNFLHASQTVNYVSDSCYRLENNAE